MSKILKKILNLTFISCFLFLTSCSIDEDLIKEENNKQKLKIININFEELIQRKDFNNALSKIQPKKKTNLELRTIMEDQYGFTISDFPAKVIEYENKTKSFTLLIIRDNILNNNDFENLVIEIDSTDNVIAKIVKYKPFLPVKIISSNNIEFHGDVELSAITYNSNQSNSSLKMVYDCVTIASSKCTGVPYDCGGDVCGFRYTNYCGYYDDGDYGGGGGTGDGTGGGTGGGTSSSTVYQDPNVTKLNSLSNNAIVKPKLTDLKGRVTDTKEHGYQFVTNTNGSLVPSNLLIGGLNGLQFPAMQINTKVRVHVHHNGLDPIPSIKDVVSFASMFKDKINLGATDAQDITSIVMSKNINYAMRVSDPVKLQDFLKDYKDPDLIDPKGQTFRQAVDGLYNNITKSANKACNNCSDVQYNALLEMYFIKAFKTLNCGISIYVSVPTTTTNPSYSWTILN